MASAMSHASHASDTNGGASFTVPALVPSIGGDSTLPPGRTPISPGAQMRQLYDINSPKVTKPGSRWTEDGNQLPDAEHRANDGTHGFAADRGVSSALIKRADSSEGTPTARSAAAATGVSTQNLTLHHVSEEHPLGKPVVVGGASRESRVSGSSHTDHLSSPTSPGKPPVHGGPHSAAPLHKQRSARKVESGGTSKDSLTLTGATSTSASGAVEVEAAGPRAFRPGVQAAAQQQQAAGTGSKDGSPGGFSPTVRTPSNPPTATPVPGGGDEVVPAGLAALLHQTDRSGKQQKAAPTPSTPSAPPPQPQFSSPAVEIVPQHQGPRKVQAPLAPAPSGFFTCCMSSKATQVEHPSPPIANPAAASSGTASQGALARGSSGSVQQGSALGASGPSQGGGGGSQQARESTASTPRESRASRDGSSEQNGAVGRGSNRKTSLDGPSRPKLSMNRFAAEPSAETPGAKGQRTPKTKTVVQPYTPSAVLSPTSLQVRTSREDVDSYAKQRTPAWGSKHPTVIHAHYETQKLQHHPSMARKTFANARGGVAAMPGTRNGGSGSYTGTEDAASFAAGASFLNMDPVHAMEKEVDALYTPSKSRKVQYGPPPGHDDPPPCQHPVGRINNVRRASSAVGEGPLLGTLMDIDQGKHCLVLDLDETLVHSSFKPVPNADYVLPVEIEGTTHYVYVCKRPGCEEFLTAVGERYEVVLFTASLAKYADPLLDLLDPHNVIRARLFREACVFHEGSYVKDMSLLGRSPASIIIVDNSPASYLFQPENALPCDSFIDDMSDTELYSLADFLIRIAGVADVRQALQQWTSGLWQGGFDLPYVYPDTARGEGEGESTAKQIMDGNGVPVRDLDTAIVRTPGRQGSHMQASTEALGTPSARGSQPGISRQSSRMKHSDSSSQPVTKRQSSRMR